jgi:hypothetical protein
MQKLQFIKLLHTIIWLIMALSILYLLYCGIMNVLNPLTWVAIALALGEAVVILANHWVCPLTPIAARYTANREPNFDIYLPLWLAKYNKHIFTPILILAIVLLAVRILSR